MQGSQRRGCCDTNLLAVSLGCLVMAFSKCELGRPSVVPERCILPQVTCWGMSPLGTPV
jgi:hypothetical protein